MDYGRLKGVESLTNTPVPNIALGHLVNPRPA